MPKAIGQHSISRRNALCGIAPLLALSVASSALGRASDDQGLIMVCEEFKAIRKSILMLDGPSIHPYGSPEMREEDERVVHLLEQSEKILERLISVPARTSRGLAAKSEIIREYLPDQLEDFELTKSSLVVRLVMGLADDVITFSESALS